MLVTSTSPVLTPALFNFDMSLFQDTNDLPDLSRCDPLILRHFDAWLKPDLDFTFGGFDVHVHSILFPRVEVKPIGSITKNSWTHDPILTLRPKTKRPPCGGPDIVVCVERSYDVRSGTGAGAGGCATGAETSVDGPEPGAIVIVSPGLASG
jgi:hypothetical protein